MHILFYEAPRILSLLVHNATIHINSNCDIFNLQYYCICLWFELIREERNVVESEQFVVMFIFISCIGVTTLIGLCLP